MSSTGSVTDIAAKISLDYSAYMQGIKMVESRAVDMAKFIANAPAASRGPDQGAQHLIDRNIEMSAVRNRIDLMRFAADRERKAIIDNAKATAEAEKEIAERSSALRIAILARYGAEADAKRERARQLDNKAYEEGKRIQQQSVDDYLARKTNEAAIEQEVQAGQEQAANEAEQAADARAKAEAQITAILDKQKVKNDEIYAQHLRDRKARSEMAAALKAGREAGVPNTVLKDAADQFKLQQAMEQRARQEQKDIEVLKAFKKAKQEDAHVIDYRNKLEEDDNNLKLRAERILRSLMTAQDLHNERVKEYTMLLNKGKFSQTQFNAAVKESERVMRTSGKGAGAYTGMLAQASFAAEDFIQGIAMGDLRAALLGASNNLTMVARGAFEAAEGMTILGMGIKTFTAYALGIPAVAGGLVAYTSWLNRAVKDTRDLGTVLRDTARGFELVEQRMSFRQQAGRERQRIDEIEDITQAQRELKKATTDQAEAEERLVKARAKRSREGTDILISTLGGQDAYIELQSLIHDLGESEHEASITLGQAMEQSLEGAFGAAQAGEAEKMINYLREINNLSNSMIMQNAKPGGLFENLNILLNDITAQDSLEAVFNTGFLQQTEDQERLREIREKMLQISLDIAKAENDVKQATTNKADSERRILELKQDQIRLQNEALKEEQRIAEQQRLQRQAEVQGESDLLEEKRKQQIFDLEATENQKEMLRIQQQMREFMGPAGTIQPLAMSSITGPLAAALMTGQMQQEAQAAGMQFLEVQATNLEKEIAALQESSSPEVIGGMQQDAFQAQADAFKQIFAAENKQPNPQLTRQIQLLTDIRAAVAAGGVIKVVGR